MKNLKVKVEAGERWAILGPNGAGKSTVAQTLLQRWEPWISVSMGLQVTCFIVYIFGFHTSMLSMCIIDSQILLL